jgi:hypothetical protein
MQSRTTQDRLARNDQVPHVVHVQHLAEDEGFTAFSSIDLAEGEPIWTPVGIKGELQGSSFEIK